jgi:hypothetical protein
MTKHQNGWLKVREMYCLKVQAVPHFCEICREASVLASSRFRWGDFCLFVCFVLPSLASLACH